MAAQRAICTYVLEASRTGFRVLPNRCSRNASRERRARRGGPSVVDTRRLGGLLGSVRWPPGPILGARGLRNMPKINPKSSPSRPQIVPETKSEFGGGLVGPFWPRLGPSWVVLGPLWASLGASSGRLGASWGRLGAIWRRLGAILGRSWGVLGSPGSSWGILELSWGRLWAVLGPSWDRLGPSCDRLGSVDCRSC